MTRIHHDAIECDPLFREGQRELEMLWIRCMIEVDGNGDGGLVSAVFKVSDTVHKGKLGFTR